MIKDKNNLTNDNMVYRTQNLYLDSELTEFS